MKLDDTLSVTPASAPDASPAAEEELFVNLEELLIPEVILSNPLADVVQMRVR